MDSNIQIAQRRLMLVMDVVSIMLAMILAATLHAALRSYISILKYPPPLEQYLLIAYLTMPMMLGLDVLFGLHRQLERPFRPWPVVWDLLRLHATSLVGIAMLVFLTQMRLNRSVVGLFLVITFALMFSSRLLLDYWRRRSHSVGDGRLHVLVVGSDTALLERVIDSTQTESLPPKLIGILESDGPPTRDALLGVPILGALNAFGRVMHEETVDEVLIATRSLSSQQFERILAVCDELGTPMRQLVLSDFHDDRRVGLERQYGLPFITLARTERSTEAIVIKRAIDLAGSSLALLVLSPLMLLIASFILVTMGRPVLYSQERIGYHGRRFRMLKFRSMVRDAEVRRSELNHRNEMSGPVFKVTGDPRITPLGRVLRKFSLDELPQLVNVLTGSMSLVGPRPLPVAEQQQITGPLRRRLSMKPGITGLWQVSGRSDLTFDEWMQLDLQYVDNNSLLLDVQLLLKTVPAVLSGRGAK